jgi:hypothetical protein
MTFLCGKVFDMIEKLKLGGVSLKLRRSIRLSMSFPVVKNHSEVITSEMFPEVFDFYPELNGRDSVPVGEIESSSGRSGV